MARKRVRFEWVEMRLEAWGKWSCSDGGLGAGAMNYGEAVGSTNYRDYTPRIGFAHREHETDRAIQGMEYDDWRTIVGNMHILGKKPKDIAEKIDKSEGFVKKEYEVILAYLSAKLGG